MRKYVKIILPAIVIIVIGVVIFIIQSMNLSSRKFDAQLAYNNVKFQMDLGPRTMGSAAHEAAAQWIISTLNEYNWKVETQEAVISGQGIKNIIAKRGSGTPWVIVASHYDSRTLADRDTDPNKRTQAVPGANDGASTVAILLELARVMPAKIDKQIWLVFLIMRIMGIALGKDGILERTISSRCCKASRIV